MKLLKGIASLALTAAASSLMWAQSGPCGTFEQATNSEEAKTAHVLYRDKIKLENDYVGAFPLWQKAYSAAPAADGQRATHYVDGRAIYTKMLEGESDAAKRAEYIAAILRLYDEEIACYKNEGFLLGRKVYDMYYTFQSPYEQTYAAAKRSAQLGGNATEYIVIAPYADIAVYFYKANTIDAEEARQVYALLEGIVKHNVANNKQFGDYYRQAWEGAQARFAEIERNIFDCDYFLKKLTPVYQADPDNRAVYTEIYQKLAQGGCDKSLPLMAEIAEKDRRYIATKQAEEEAELRRTNPAFDAKKLFEEGKEDQAIARFKEAIAQEPDASKKGDYALFVAKILYKQGRKGEARSMAYDAAKFRPNWGEPYLLIGDLYASSAKGCGETAFEQAMVIQAARDKWVQAKNMDPSVASEANEKLGRYAGYKADQDTGFMQGFTEGSSYRVGCWIGETVTVRY